MRILICGFGRSGKRHARILTSMGIVTGIYDINPISYDDIDEIYGIQRPAIFGSYDEFIGTIKDGMWDVAVICTPPSFHLQYIEVCLDYGMSVSCEKPLCGFGQLDKVNKLLNHPDISKVQVQYNYRFNPDMKEFDTRWISGNNAWQLIASQYRESVPNWSLLLDHCSHDLDMIRWMSHENISEIESAQAVIVTCEPSSLQSIVWTIHGKLDSGNPIYIFDQVNLVNPNHGRIAKAISPLGTVQITPNYEMFTKMWESFFESYRTGIPQEPSFEEAARTQYVLQECYEKSQTIQTRIS